jgi:segregation and condensation protein B
MEEVQQARGPAEEEIEPTRELQGEMPLEASPEEHSPDFEDNHFVVEAVSDTPAIDSSATLKAVIEAVIYITDEPLTAEQIASALEQPHERVKEILNQLVAEYSAPDRGLSIRELAGGYKVSTKPEHHESIRRFVKKLQPPLKLSLAALETLAVIAYKQPITAPEIMDIRGVQGAGVLKTLLDRKLIAAAGRKNVLGKPIMYKTTRDFLIQFGLSTLAELPTLKEFEELGRFALDESGESAAADESQTVSEEQPATPGSEEAELKPEASENNQHCGPDA